MAHRLHHTYTMYLCARRLREDETGGSDFVELLILMAAIALVVIVGVNVLGDRVKEKYECLAAEVEGGGGGGCGPSGSGAGSFEAHLAALQRALNDPNAKRHGDWELPDPDPIRGMEDYEPIKVSSQSGRPAPTAAMRAWNPTDAELVETFGYHPDHEAPPAPSHRTDRFKPIDDALTALAGGFGNGVLTVAELALRLPETLRRTDDALDAASDAYVRALGGSPETDEIPSLARRVLDALADLSNEGADSVAALRARQSERHAGYLVAQKHDEANQALDAAMDGDLGPLGDVLTDPAAWTGFAGEAVPSLAAMAAGGIPAIVALTSSGVTAQVDAYEKQTGEEVDPLSYGATLAMTVPASTALEALGVKGMKGPGSKVLSFLSEGSTESGQTLVENTVFKITIDEDQKISEGALAAGMSGLSGPMISAAASTRTSDGQAADEPGPTLREKLATLVDVMTEGMTKSPLAKQAGFIALSGATGTSDFSQSDTVEARGERYRKLVEEKGPIEAAKERLRQELAERQQEGRYPAEQAVMQRIQQQEHKVDPRPFAEPAREDLLLNGVLDDIQRQQLQQMLDEAEARIATEEQVETATQTHVSSESVAETASATGPLGAAGPLGAWGPLGAVGPLGTFGVEKMISSYDWSHWSSAITEAGGPLSAEGPLGPNGALAHREALASMGDLGDVSAEELDIGGTYTAVGPFSTLGALGALGPLGTVGAHGYRRNSHGDFVDSEGNIVRTLEVPFGPTKEAADRPTTHELFEHYTEARAKEMTDNDTSFMVEGDIGFADGKREVDAFRFTSRADQVVTVQVVPEHSLDDFDLVVTDEAGAELYSSSSEDLMEFIQFRAPAGETYYVRVKLASHRHWFLPSYRLYVTGSGGDFVN